MKRILITFTLIFTLILPVIADEFEEVNPLPRGLAPQEIGLPLPQSDDPTHPPEEPCRALAEWEEVEAIIFR